MERKEGEKGITFGELRQVEYLCWRGEVDTDLFFGNSSDEEEVVGFDWQTLAFAFARAKKEQREFDRDFGQKLLELLRFYHYRRYQIAGITGKDVDFLEDFLSGFASGLCEPE